MTIYEVWSIQDKQNKLETRRTDKADAVSDVGLIKSIMHRHAWIEEITETNKQSK